MKNLKFILIMLVAFLFVGFATNVNADEPVVVTSLEELTANAKDSSIKLGADITLTANIALDNVTLDLNNHTISTNGNVIVARGDIIFKDSGDSGKIVNSTDVTKQVIQISGNFTFESGTVEAKSGYALLVYQGAAVINGGTLTANGYTILVYSNLTINDGNVSSGNGGFTIYQSPNKNSKVTINGGVISTTSTDQAVSLSDSSTAVMNGGKISAPNGIGVAEFKNTSFTMNDGVIESKSHGLSGNGSMSGTNEGTNATFTIKGGSITSTDGPAIYAPQIEGESTISGGKLVGHDVAVEVRAGKLTITGGELEATANSYSVDGNGNGSTTVGSAVAVVQHTTKQAIDVTIKGGTFKACLPVSEANPQENSAEDIAKVNVSITGGEFTTTCDSVVGSEDNTKFISGGTYSAVPEDKYIKDEYDAYENSDGTYVIDKDVTLTVAEDTIYVEKGKTVSDVYSSNKLKYVTAVVEDTSVATLDGTSVKGVAVGNTKVTVTLNKANDPVVKTVGVSVYEIKDTTIVSETDENEVQDSSKSIVKNNLSSIVADVMNEKENITGVDSDTAEAIKDAVIDGAAISTEIYTEEVKEADVKSDLAIINKVLDKDSKVAGLYDISIKVLADGDEIGNITELSKAIEIKFEVPSDLPKVKEGYTRMFTVTRLHDGVATKLATTAATNGVVTVKSNKFSLYALTYSDVKEGQLDDVPKTGVVIAPVVLGTITVGAALAFVNKKRH